MTKSMEVVVIGSGINGLSAAALLAVSGKKVIVLESNPVAGGAIRTGEVTAPGFRPVSYTHLTLPTNREV